jgi:Tol biopolymer transport system component/DNA-binding winged helix-turn-helix (wHTH) protein
MFKEEKEIYEFGQFRLDVTERLLTRQSGSRRVRLSQKAFETLCILVRNSGHLLSKEKILAQVWADSFVEENNLDKCIYALRQALGEKPGEHKFIETVRKHGYRFVAEVRRVACQDAETETNENVFTPSIAASLPHPASASQSGAVVAIADWRHEAGEKKPKEFAPPESNEQISIPKLELAPARTRKKIRRGRRVLVLAGLVAAAVAFAGLGYGLYLNRQSKTSAVFNLKNIKRLTSNKNSSHPAISPDGKYVAFVLREAANRLSIQLLHIETGATKEIFAPPEHRDIGWLNFSPDGNYIYFLQLNVYGTESIYGLYRMSMLGGVPAKLLADLHAYAISPDGAKLAFARNYQDAGESVLLIADAAGANEYRLAQRKLSDPFYALNWSPDGETITATVGSAEVSGKRMYPVEINLADGRQREITPFRWTFLGRAIRLPDENGFVAVGIDDLTATSTLWHISDSDGETRRLTDDSQVYSVISLTRDAKSLVFQNLEFRSSIWTASIEEGAASEKQVTAGNEGSVVSYMPDGRLLFTSPNTRLQYDVWIINADGSERRKLTENAGTNMMPVASPDGRFIVFESDRAGKINIWRMDADGANPKQLTFGSNEKGPDVSPDGKWVVFTSGDDSTLRRVPLEGGETERLTCINWRGALVSPDGKWILSSYKEPRLDAKRRIGLIPFDGGEPVRMFDVPPELKWYLNYQWMPDARAFIYPASREGIFNIWKQPITGGNPEQLTDFKSMEQIYSPNFSPDGKQLVFLRGGWTFDIFLAQDFR